LTSQNSTTEVLFTHIATTHDRIKTNLYRQHCANIIPTNTSNHLAPNKQEKKRKCIETIEPTEQVACFNGKYEK